MNRLPPVLTCHRLSESIRFGSSPSQLFYYDNKNISQFETFVKNFLNNFLRFFTVNFRRNFYKKRNICFFIYNKVKKHVKSKFQKNGNYIFSFSLAKKKKKCYNFFFQTINPILFQKRNGFFCPKMQKDGEKP